MKRLNWTMAILISALLVFSFAFGQAVAADKPVKLKLGVHWPTTHVLHPVMLEWVKDIEASSDGRIQVKFYHSGTLSTLKRALEISSTGVADIVNLCPPYYPGQLPSFRAPTLPFLFSSATQASKVLTDMIPKYFNKECESNNIKLLGIFTPPIYQLVNTKSAQNIEEVKGFRVRSVGASDEILKALGAKPLMVAPPEIYTSLQRGIIDSVLYPVCAATAFKFHEVAKYVTVANVYTTNIIFAMNLDAYNALPADLQKVVSQAGMRAAAKCAAVYDAKEVEHFGIWKKKGINFHQLSDAEMARWKKRAAPLADQWVVQAEAKGVPGREIMDQINTLAAKYK